MAETEDFAYAMSKNTVPSLKEIDDACPVFTDEEITFINHHIDYEKCIPSLPYVHDPTFYNHSAGMVGGSMCLLGRSLFHG